MRERQALASRLKLKQLRLVVALGAQASIRHAADMVGMSQPTATKLLQEIEADLGTTLFSRTNRGVVPTQYGQALIKHGRLVLAQLAHAGQELEDLAQGTGGRVAVGTLLAASTVILPAAIVRLHTMRPQVSVDVVQGTNSVLIPALRAGDLDFVLGRLAEYRYRDELVQDLLYHERVCIVARAGHPLVGRRKLSALQLLKCDWILPPPDTSLRRQIETAFHDAGQEPPRPSVQSISLQTNRVLLLSTDMIGVLPEQVIADDVASGVLKVLSSDLRLTASQVGITQRRNAVLSPAAQMLVDEIKAAAHADMDSPAQAAAG
jgi:DNA-binding transcriptional LysR family regulator